MGINLEKAIADIRNVKSIQCSNGNWNYDPYMHGMANGLILALSFLEGVEPEYLDAPEKWLSSYADQPNLEWLKMKATQSAILPDGSAFFTASDPLPEDHWIYQQIEAVPKPMIDTSDPKTRERVEDQIWIAARYAVRASTMNGRETDFDPDAMVQNMVVGLVGPRNTTYLDLREEEKRSSE